MKKNSKKIITILIASITALSLTSCGNNKDTTNNSPANSYSADIVSPDTNETAQLDKFVQFETGLSQKNIEYETIEKMGNMVGAKEGYGYKFIDGTSVELYLFDKDSTEYKEAVKTNKLYLEAFDIYMDVVFNDDMCIYYDENISSTEYIEEIFNNLR